MKELLFSVTKKDFDVQFMRAGGAGGQHQNKTSSACRIVHKASGAVGESREHREQGQNKKEAFNRCIKSKIFQGWLKLRASELMLEETLEQKVDKLMQDCFIKTEVHDDTGKWIKTSLEDLND